MRRGDTRTALLAALVEAPAHGYELMQRIEEKSEGAWRPSPGSVYPTLQLLEDEGLVRVAERDGKRIFEITDEGRAEAERRVDEAGGAPWEILDGGSGRGALRESVRLLGLAVRQTATVGSKEQIDATNTILTDARKRVYQLLGES
jgi:DNA-binding PadR family transcriptional regulator